MPCQWLPQAGIVTLAACHRDGHPGRRVASDGPGLAGFRASVGRGSESTIDVKAVRRFAATPSDYQNAAREILSNKYL